LAIEIVSLLKKKSLPVHLTMIGPDKDGSLQKCKDLVRKLNLESNVVFTGRLTKQEWIGLSKEHNIFLNTTSVDNTPVSVMEAMALGIPVLTTKVGGIPFLFEDEHEGIMVNDSSSLAFADVICHLWQSSVAINNLSQNARMKAETWDWRIVYDKWKNIFESIK
jgi:glycosyltransferase involved in cell wall biosynthesis